MNLSLSYDNKLRKGERRQKKKKKKKKKRRPIPTAIVVAEWGLGVLQPFRPAATGACGCGWLASSSTTILVMVVHKVCGCYLVRFSCSPNFYCSRKAGSALSCRIIN